MQVENIIIFLNFQLIKGYEIDSIFWIETEYILRRICLFSENKMKKLYIF